MSVLYQILCDVRTALLNAVGVQFLLGRGSPNVEHILNSIVSELENSGDFMEGIINLSEEELADLGFCYLHEDDNFMLFPVWLYPVIPEDTSLINIEGYEIVKGTDMFNIHCNHWLSVGFKNTT